MALKFKPPSIFIKIILVQVSLLLTSCTSPMQAASTMTALNQLPPIPDNTQTIGPNFSQGECTLQKEESLCRCATTLVTDSNVLGITWSMDSQDLFFREADNSENWSVYSITQKRVIEQINKLPDNPNGFDPATGEASTYGIVDYEDLFVSPESTKVVFTLRNGDDLAVKMLTDKDTVVDLGSIFGMVDKVYWNDEGTELLISMNWQSPVGIADSFVYKVDPINRTINSAIPNDAEHQGTTLIGVSPDFKWILFVKYYGLDRSIWLREIVSGKELKTNVGAPPLHYQWLSSSTFIGVGYFEDVRSIRVYTYDIVKNVGRLVGTDSINAHPYISNSVLISPNIKYIAFIEQNSQKLYIIRCYESR